MAVIQKLVDLDARFRALERPPLFLNDFSKTGEEERKVIQQLVMVTYSEDMVSCTPQCVCGHLRGQSNLATECPVCKTLVSSQTSDTVTPLLWLRRPEGIAPLLTPVVWIMLEQFFNRSKRASILRWLTDSGYKVSGEPQKAFYQMLSLNLPRGYNAFIENFLPTMERLFALPAFALTHQRVAPELQFLRDFYPQYLVQHLPMINKTLLVVEKTELATYIDNTVPAAIEAMETFVSLDNEYRSRGLTFRQNRLARGLFSLSCKFFQTYFNRIVNGKYGILRHYLGGSRLDYTARMVISSLETTERYDNIHVSWGVATVVFRPFLVNKLRRKTQWKINDIADFLHTHVEKYHPLLDQCFQEILSESPEGRYPVLLNRFPTLLQGSFQKVYISKIKTDTHNKTLSINTSIAVAPNADYDGDQMYIFLSLDRQMAHRWHSLSPHFNVFSTRGPFEISPNLSIPKNMVATLASWAQEPA